MKKDVTGNSSQKVERRMGLIYALALLLRLDFVLTLRDGLPYDVL